MVNDPPRMRELVGGDDAGRLFEAARAYRPPSDGPAHALAALGLGPVAGTVTALHAGKAATTFGLKHLVVTCGVLAATASSLVAARSILHHPEGPSRTAVSNPASEPIARPLPDVDSIPAPTLIVVPTSPPPPAPSAHTHTRKPSLADETAQLDRARAALRAGRSADALTELDEFGHRFPHARLTDEATVTRIEALLLAGRRAEAEALGRRVLGKPDGTLYAERIRAKLGWTETR